MEIPCTHTSPTALISWSGRRNAGHRLSRRENFSGMHGAGMSPSPESFEEPAWICVLPRVNQRPGSPRRTLLRSSARDAFLESPDLPAPGTSTHPTNKNTHVLMEPCEEPHLLTDCTRRRLHRRIVDEPMSSQSSLTPTATRQPNPGKDGAFRFEHACWSRAHPLDRAGELRSMHVPAARQHRAQSARPGRGQHRSQALDRHDLAAGQPGPSIFESWTQTA